MFKKSAKPAAKPAAKLAPAARDTTKDYLFPTDEDKAAAYPVPAPPPAPAAEVSGEPERFRSGGATAAEIAAWRAKHG